MSSGPPEAIFCAPLEGDAPLRYVYVDEAGTSAREPVSVVVGIIIDADRHWQAAHDRVQELIEDFVPAERRKDFIFHAKPIWGDDKIRANWPFEDRMQLLHGMMRVPRELDLAFSMGVVRRDPNRFDGFPDKGARLLERVSISQFEHCLAFGLCLQEADRYIRTYAAPRELGTVVAEDVPEIAKFLRLAIPIHRDNPQLLSDAQIRPTAAERETGVIDQNREFRITKLVDTVHFVEKKNAPLLQIADAIAFGMRRWLAGQSEGLNFARSCAEEYRLVDEDWAGDMSCGLYYWHPKKSASKPGIASRTAKVFRKLFS
jgi:hypothetical protein